MSVILYDGCHSSKPFSFFFSSGIISAPLATTRGEKKSDCFYADYSVFVLVVIPGFRVIDDLD